MTPQRSLRGRAATRPAGAEEGHIYQSGFVRADEAGRIRDWLASITPLWERRFKRGDARNRWLLRPVYWLGAWQFACLDYYRPPRGVIDRCVRAEPLPAVLSEIVRRIESLARRSFSRADVPPGWKLNTCLVNLYGSRRGDDGRWQDAARVGEHRDFEPGPVASISLGERALIQFVRRSRPGEPAPVVLEQWLDDLSLELFAGPLWKEKTLHRVQRVDRRAGCVLPPEIDGFRTRRVNFTFRYVPDEHIVEFNHLSKDAREEVEPYVEQLARHSDFFAAALRRGHERAASERER